MGYVVVNKAFIWTDILSAQSHWSSSPWGDHIWLLDGDEELECAASCAAHAILNIRSGGVACAVCLSMYVCAVCLHWVLMPVYCIGAQHSAGMSLLHQAISSKTDLMDEFKMLCLQWRIGYQPNGYQQKLESNMLGYSFSSYFQTTGSWTTRIATVK